MSVPCKLIDGKKYSRPELNSIAKACKIKYILKYKKNELIDKIKEVSTNNTTNSVSASSSASVSASSNNNTEICIKNVFSKCNISITQSELNDIMKIVKDKNVAIPTSVKEISFAKPVKDAEKKPAANNFEEFARYFDEELMGFVRKPNKKPLMRAFVPGGYGLRMLLEHRYNKTGVIKPGDLDITISINDSKLSQSECRTHLIDKCKKFINSRHDLYNYRMTIMNFPPDYNPLLKMRRFCLISLTYKSDEFVDLVITDRDIPHTEIDTTVSDKCDLPIKKPEGYLFEYFQIIYMENVPGIDHYCYLKRNPVTGKFSCKGVKDIDRVTVLCKLANSKKYEKYCNIVKQVTGDKLKTMSKEQRDKVFLELRNIM
jgi:hypothetical protein